MVSKTNDIQQIILSFEAHGKTGTDGEMMIKDTGQKAGGRTQTQEVSRVALASALTLTSHNHINSIMNDINYQRQGMKTRGHGRSLSFPRYCLGV